MAFIEMMSQEAGEEGFFTVNTAASPGSVDIGYTDVDTDGLFVNPEGNSVFTYKDNFEILSIGCRLPLAFEFGEKDVSGYRLPKIVLRIREVGEAWTQLDIPKNLFLPFGNYELSVGVLGLIPDTITNDFQIGAVFGNANVSMFNVDTSLNTIVYHVPIFIKVLHTIELTAVP